MEKRTFQFLFAAWVLSVVATVGSLFFSEVMGFYPCVMCWYQRICMYPLSLIFLTALWNSDSAVFRYTLPLSVIGWGFSIYQLLLYFNVLPESAAPCVEGASCTTVYIQWFGFVTIPMLSFLAFFLLILLQIKIRKGCFYEK